MSRFYISLEDDLMRIFAKDWVRNVLGKLGMEEGQEIRSKMVSRMTLVPEARVTRAIICA